jgi:hypothetical protein
MASRKKAGAVVGRRLDELVAVDAQLQIRLRHVKPAVWRRVIVPETITLAKLHTVIQVAMGWTDSHLHQYLIDGQIYGMPDPDWETDPPARDERRVRLKALIEAGVRKLAYEYDFGDGWEHDVTIEDLVTAPSSGPRVRCTAGANACPPEDVGGYGGYASFLAAIADPEHPEHDDTLSWVGYPFDPTAFDLNAVNQRLARIKA